MEFSKDTIQTNSGELEITFVGHGSLMMEFDAKVIHIDPWSSLTDYSKLPKADVILITHDHRDHLDTKAIELIRTEKTIVVAPEKCADRIDGAVGYRLLGQGQHRCDAVRVADIQQHALGELTGHVVNGLDRAHANVELAQIVQRHGRFDCSRPESRHGAPLEADSSPLLAVAHSRRVSS